MQDKSCQKKSWPLHKGSCLLQRRILVASRAVNPDTDRLVRSLQRWARHSTTLLSFLLFPILIPGVFQSWCSGREAHLHLQLLGPPRPKNLLITSSSLSFPQVTRAIGSNDMTVPAYALPVHTSGLSLGKRYVILRVVDEMVYLRVLLDVQWLAIAYAPRELREQALHLWAQVFRG